MAEDENTTAQTQNQQRRSSFTAQTLSGLFGTRSRDNDNPALGPITTAATNARNRRMSLTTLGLSSSPETLSRFNALRNQRDSLGSSPGSIDESAIEDDVGPREANSPGSSFQRRASFGARAFMDVRTGGNNNLNNGGGQNGEGFNWSENLRNRAERSSIASSSPADRSQAFHTRAKSVAVMEPPIAELPRTATRPDHFQERILKGDFYMD